MTIRVLHDKLSIVNKIVLKGGGINGYNFLGSSMSMVWSDRYQDHDEWQDA